MFVAASVSPGISPTRANATSVGTTSLIWPFVTPVPVGSNEYLALKVVDDNHIWVARGKNLVATADGGKNWQLQATLAGTIHSVEFVSTVDGWVATDTGLYATHDGGRTWQPVAGAPDGADRVDFVDSQHGWIAATKQGVLATGDGGRHWTQTTEPCYSGDAFAHPTAGLFDFVDPLTG